MTRRDAESSVTEEARREDLGPVLDQNIRRLEQHRQAEETRAPLEERLAARITAATGSMGFVYAHLAVVACWVAVNLGLVPVVRPFDPTFVILATAASVEAIFLSTFVLISQNRDAAIAERRAQLDLHVNLLSEREITTLVKMVKEIAAKLDIPLEKEPEVDDAQRKITPEKVLDRLAER